MVGKMALEQVSIFVTSVFCAHHQFNIAAYSSTSAHEVCECFNLEAHYQILGPQYSDLSSYPLAVG
jgi:hypothetical protein